MSNALEGYGNLSVAMIPIRAGTPRSRANWTCASCVSFGAKDTGRMFRESKYAPQLATYKVRVRFESHHCLEFYLDNI